MTMNGHDSRAELEKQRELKERSLRLAKELSDKIALDLVAVVTKNYPHMHPGIVSTALVNTMASIIVLFARTEEQALQGVDATAKQLRQTVIRMAAEDARKRGAGGS
jgi:hypothetical protein